MVDVITYVPELRAFREEVKTIAQGDNGLFTLLDDGSVATTMLHVPVGYSVNQSVSVIRLANESLLDKIKKIEIIGHVIDGEYVFLGEGQDKYESVYNTKTRKVIIDGVEVDFTPPYKIGVFA